MQPQLGHPHAVPSVPRLSPLTPFITPLLPLLPLPAAACPAPTPPRPVQTRVTSYGAFVEFGAASQGLVHVSQIAVSVVRAGGGGGGGGVERFKLAL